MIRILTGLENIQESFMREAKNRAFTLVEIMIAVGIFGIVFTTVMYFWIEMMRTDTATRQAADNLASARSILLNFEKDMREAVDVINFDETDDYTNIQIMKYKPPDRNAPTTYVPEYIIYTLYKKEGVIEKEGLQEKPICLAFEKTDERPPPDKKATDRILIKQTIKPRSEQEIGLVMKWTDPNSNPPKELESYIYGYNIHYDPSIQNNQILQDQDKEKERARCRFKGKDNGTLVGFEDFRDIVAIEIQIITNDLHQVHNVFHSFIYLRKKLYDTLYD